MSHKYHKIVNNFILKQTKKFFKAKTQRIIVLFTPKFVTTQSKISVRILDQVRTYSGSRIQGQIGTGTGSRIRIRNTGNQKLSQTLAHHTPQVLHGHKRYDTEGVNFWEILLIYTVNRPHLRPNNRQFFA